MNRRRFLSHFGTTLLATALPAAAGAQSMALAGGMAIPTDYGVIPDAAIDQSAAFQAMLESAAMEGLGIFLPGGSYFVSGIRIPPGTLLEGVPGRTQIMRIGDEPLLAAEYSDGIVLRGLTLDGGNASATGADRDLLEFTGVRMCTFEDCSIQGQTLNGIRLHACSGTIRSCTISGAGQFAVYATDSLGLSITGNTIDRCANGSIVVHRGAAGHDGTVVSGNHIRDTGAANGGTGQWGNAINFFRADDVIASGNVITGSAFSAVRGNTVRGMQVTGNICRDNGETAIYAEFAFEDAVIADNIIEGAANGISATNLDHGGHGATISGNIIRNIRNTGPYEPDYPGFGTGIGVEADAVVTGNLVDGAALYGINAGWGPFLRDVLIASNTVRDARIGIGVSAAEGAGRAMVRDNFIAAKEMGIQAHAWGEATAPDLLVEPSAAPDNISVAGNIASSG